MSREVDPHPEGGLTRQRNARPSFLITCCVWETPSKVDVTFHNVYDEPELPEHEVQEPEDAHEGAKPYLICQDTTCSRHDLFKTHFTMLVSVSHPMSISPVIEYVAPAPAVTLVALSPAIEYVAPTPVVTCAAPSSSEIV